MISLCKYVKNHFTMAQRINFVGNQKRFLSNDQTYEEICSRKVVVKEVGEVQDGPRAIYPPDYETQLPTAAQK